MLRDDSPDPQLTEDNVVPVKKTNNTSSRSKVKKRKPKRSLQESGVSIGIKSGKQFVLDTNVLLHDPGAVHKFADNHVCIPVEVLAELDRFKGRQSELGANARRIHRELSSLFEVSLEEVTKGIPLEGGGTVRMVVFDSKDFSSERSERLWRLFSGSEQTDNRILATALAISESSKVPTILVTKDLNLQLKGRAVGLEVQDYLNDKVDPDEVDGAGIRTIELDATLLQRFASTGLLESGILDLGIESYINEYLLLSAGEGTSLMPARVGKKGSLQRLRTPLLIRPGNGCVIKPLNLGQQCLMDALLDPEISLVTSYGDAGTGKTLVSVAAGLAQTLDHHYRGLTISRPLIAMGDTLGFLPGTLDEKMNPWLQPIYDALDFLMRPSPKKTKTTKAKKKVSRKTDSQDHIGIQGKPWERLIEQGLLEIEALCYIRGRSIPNRYFVLDEAQQLSPHEAKTVVTRMSAGSKLVMVGDPAQIDNPYVDGLSNGLVYTRDRMKGEPSVAHVPLSKGERSPLAEAAAHRM